MAKEGIESVLKEFCISPNESIEKVIEKLGLKAISEEEIEKIVEDILKKYPNLAEQKKFSAIMGEAMKILRGKADGKIVAEVIKRKLAI